MNLHRSCVVAAIVATILVPGGTTVAAEGAPAAFEIPRLDGIAVDGDPSDWGERGLSVDAVHWHSVRTSVADFDPHYRIGWNDTGLLVRAVVRDDALVSAPDPSGSLYGVLTADTLVVKASTGTDKPMVSQAVVCLGDAPDRGKVKIKTGLPGATVETSETVARRRRRSRPTGMCTKCFCRGRRWVWRPPWGPNSPCNCSNVMMIRRGPPGRTRSAHRRAGMRP